VLQYHEIVRQILYDEPRPRRPLDSYEYDKYIHIVDIPLKDSIIGHIDGKRNLLICYFWALMFAIMNDTNLTFVNTSGISYGLRSSGDMNRGSAYLVYGSGVSPEIFYQNSLVSYSGSISTAVSFGQLSDRNRITLSGIAPDNAQEIGIYQVLIDVNNSSQTTMLARKVIYVPKGKAINYYIDFLMPWSYNWALLMYGILLDANVSGAIDADGNTYTLRSSGDVNAGVVRMRLSTTLYSWSPSLTNISYVIEPPTYRFLGHYTSYEYLFLLGATTPSSDISINTISVVQSLYDTGGVGHDTYILILPLQTPITLYAGRVNIIFLRLIAM